MTKSKTKKEAAQADKETAGPAEKQAAQTDEMEAVKGEHAELNNQFLRLRADFENFRKRTVKERAEIARRSNENLLADLIPVLDHFEMGLETARSNEISASIYDGFKLVYDQLWQAVEKAGVERIDAEGEVFNPHLHECIAHIPSDDVPEGSVSAQTRCGYQIGNYILRAAQVVVSSGPAMETDNNKVDEE